MVICYSSPIKLKQGFNKNEKGNRTNIIQTNTELQKGKAKLQLSCNFRLLNCIKIHNDKNVFMKDSLASVYKHWNIQKK